ncbi:MAG: hypothetical protein M5U34_08355 [Chloroflexi bacterium]|nr:hypothetical protein [Chloroflexota bacterium]
MPGCIAPTNRLARLVITNSTTVGGDAMGQYLCQTTGLFPHRLARVFHLPTVARARQPVTRHGVKPGSCPAASPLRIASPATSTSIQPW